VQDIRLVEAVPVVYSLGNFIFDQYFSTAVQEGLLLGVKLDADKLVLNLYPHSSHGTLSRPQLIADDKKQIFLTNLAMRSDNSLTTAIESGQIVLPRPGR
jgi:poly-gamma-glutamate synthesis protein (capsule biosynthesis protein)